MPASVYTETTPCLSRDILRSTSLLRPQKQTRRNNKKISLHRFKPVIFSKMIQNCQNQVEGGGYSRLARERGCHRGRENREALDGSLVSASVSHSAFLPSPVTTVHVGPQWSPRGGSAWSLSGLVCFVSPRRCWVGGLESTRCPRPGSVTSKAM